MKTSKTSSPLEARIFKSETAPSEGSHLWNNVSTIWGKSKERVLSEYGKLHPWLRFKCKIQYWSFIPAVLSPLKIAEADWLVIVWEESNSFVIITATDSCKPPVSSGIKSTKTVVERKDLKQKLVTKKQSPQKWLCSSGRIVHTRTWSHQYSKNVLSKHTWLKLQMRA